MFGTTASKLAASVILVATSATGVARVDQRAATDLNRIEVPVGLDSTSLLVATLQNGELQTQWMPRDACEQVASAVAAGDHVAGVRQDGVKITIARANCSTRRIEADPSAVALSSSGPAN